MHTNHIFFGSFAAWQQSLDMYAGVYGLPISRSEKTNVSGVSQVSLLIHLSQLRDDRAYHCLILAARYLDPVHQEEVQRLQTRLDAAWNAVKQWLAAERITLIEAVVSYPQDLHVLTVALPEGLRGPEAQP